MTLDTASMENIMDIVRQLEDYSYVTIPREDEEYIDSLLKHMSSLADSIDNRFTNDY